MIRVLVAEDHAIVRRGLEQLLAGADDVEIVASAANGPEAVELAARHRPDVVLMDLVMPEFGGVEATRRIVGADGDVKVVVLTSFSDRRAITEALDAGAIGYLLKDGEPDELIRGIRAAAAGESPLAPKAARELLRERTKRPETELSPREREVLVQVASGLPNKLIALRLGISEKTVKAHLTSVFAQIGVTDRTQAALWAQREGLV
ncbi:MAG TPA: response regulator transcription factor [Gaiellaceae bacterium]|nr:response regulator transcription factor [Gaiellaceae bacterium]